MSHDRKPMTRAQLVGTTQRLLQCRECMERTMHVVTYERRQCVLCSMETESAEAIRQNALIAKARPEREPATITEAFDAAVQTLCGAHARELAARDEQIKELQTQLAEAKSEENAA